MADTNNTSGTGPKGNTNNNLRSRIWQWTLNNYTEKENDQIKTFALAECVYSVYQPEKGKNGTPHLQGMFEFKNARTFQALKERFPRMHLEKCKKRDALIKYCKKEDTKTGDTIEIGTIAQLDEKTAQEAGWEYILKSKGWFEDYLRSLEEIEKNRKIIREYERYLAAKDLEPKYEEETETEAEKEEKYMLYTSDPCETHNKKHCKDCPVEF